MCKGFPNCCCKPVANFEETFNNSMPSKCWWVFEFNNGSVVAGWRRPDSRDETVDGTLNLPRRLQTGLSFFRSNLIYRAVKLNYSESIRMTIEARFQSDWQLPNCGSITRINGPRVSFARIGAMRLNFNKPPGSTTDSNTIEFVGPNSGGPTVSYTMPSGETISDWHELKLEMEMLFDGTPGFKARMWYQGTERIEGIVGSGTRTNLNMTFYNAQIATRQLYAVFDSVFVQSKVDWAKFKIEAI